MWLQGLQCCLFEHFGEVLHNLAYQWNQKFMVSEDSISSNNTNRSNTLLDLSTYPNTLTVYACGNAYIGIQ